MLRSSPIYSIAITSGLLLATLASGVHAAQPTATPVSQDGQVNFHEFPWASDLDLQQLLNLESQLLAQQQQSKVALVIGNAAYEDDPLANPVNDATAIHQALDELGFDVLPLVTNADEQGMAEAIRDFRNRLEAGAVGVFYYAGHGVQVDGVNYLVPVDAEMEYEFEVESEAIDLDRVIRAMEDADTQFNVLIIDACRDNPFYRRWRRQNRSFSTRGLTSNRPPRGTLIAYATEPNDVADDGYGYQNSPFTQALLSHIRTPNLNIQLMLNQVALDVLEATNESQFPWTEGNLIGDFSFNPQEVEAPIALPVAEPEPSLTEIDSPQDETVSPIVIEPEAISEQPIETSLDLTQLRSFAQAGNWQQADEETSALLLQLGDEDDSGRLSSTEVEALSCPDLRAIDQVWSAASDGRFGFSAQAQIWQEVGSPTEYNEQWEEFGDRVGWRKDGNWIINYDQLLFDTTAPNAHLPTWHAGGFFGGGDFFFGTLGMILSSTALCEL